MIDIDDEEIITSSELSKPVRTPVIGPKLAGRTAIITGASMGFGAAITEAFLREGAKVVMYSRDRDSLERQHRILSAMFPESELSFLAGDVSVKDQLDDLFMSTIDAFGSFEIVVNNAGAYGPMGRLDEINWDDWIDAIDTNLMGAVYSCRLAIKHFRKTGYGKIINLSGGGATNPLPGLSAYAASKAALVRFTETVALECKQADTNCLIDINSVAPGPLATRMNEQVIAVGPDAVGQLMYERSIALRNNGGTDPAIGANLCVYLASADSDGITGKLISAVWDKWPFDEEMRERLKSYDLFTLRRITEENERKL